MVPADSSLFPSSTPRCLVPPTTCRAPEPAKHSDLLRGRVQSLSTVVSRLFSSTPLHEPATHRRLVSPRGPGGHVASRTNSAGGPTLEFGRSSGAHPFAHSGLSG